MTPEETKVREWFSYQSGPKTADKAAVKAARDEMRAIGKNYFPILTKILASPDLEDRCRAVQAILTIDAPAGQELVLPMLLHDPVSTVRWHTCGCLHDFGDERAVEALIGVMKNDTKAQVRNMAAYALGGIEHLAAIPALLEAMASDHEFDELGYSTSDNAATSIFEILTANGIQPPENEADLPRQARAAYERWKISQSA